MVDDITMMALNHKLNEKRALEQEILRDALQTKRDEKVHSELKEIRRNLDRVTKKKTRRPSKRSIVNKYAR